jgi:3-hydroxybutyryl-CoA dehydrogenase
MVLELDRIGVTGAGMMGSEIALVFALAGKEVRLFDVDQSKLDLALSNLASVLDKGIEREAYRPEDKTSTLARIQPTLRMETFSDRDFVIEAVFEIEAVKNEVLAALDKICRPECVLSTNTSSISVTVLSGALAPEHRGRFIGTHFFSPVSRMQLVEVIPGLDTRQEVVEVVLTTCLAVGKEPVRVKDVVGFAVNRLLHSFLIEAARLVEEGVANPADIDIACRLGLGHPLGPFELMDMVTNDLTLEVQEILAEAYGERFRPSPLLKQLVRVGYHGRKAGRGWHHHEKAN